MHIAHLNLNDGWGGGEYQILHLACGAIAAGETCTLFALADGPLARRASAAGVPVVPVRRRAASCELAAALAAARCELLHAHDSEGLGVGGAAARRLGLPLVYSRRIASPLRRNILSRRKYGPERVAAVIAISETVRRTFLASAVFPAERVHVVHSGVDTAGLAAIAPDPDVRAFAAGGVLAGGLGKLAPKKNWGFLVEVAATVRDQGVDHVRWVIAGDGAERRRLEARIRRLGLEDRVRLLGFRSDAAAVIKSLDVLFFPSLMEGAGVTVMEAMALTVPVVAVGSEGVAETLGGCGRLVADGDVAAAARHVTDLAQNPAAARQLATRAHSRVRQYYDMPVTIAGNLAVYRTLR